MKAAFIEKLGDPDRIQIGELPIPNIKENEILVKVHAVSANHVDTFVRSGGFKTKMDFPFVIGRDAVGSVVKIGSKVSNFRVGEQVWTNSMGYDGRQGTTSEFVAVPQERLYPVPDQVDPLKLVASVHSSATAIILLNSILRVKSGSKILIEGAAGHVGKKLVTISRNEGLEVTTTSNVNDFEQLNRLGAKYCYDYHQSIKNIGQTFDYIVDTSGKVDLSNNLSLLNLKGQVGLITAPRSDEFTFSVRDFYMNLKQIKGFVISHATTSQLSKAALFLNQYFSNDKLLDDELLELSYKDVKYAHKLLESNEKHHQRIVLKF